jgi:hypothetical protein
MLKPSAGSGGGASGGTTQTSNTTYGGYQVSGAAGGAGGGFLDFTSQSTINIFGTIDARGGAGGNGGYQQWNGSGGGGGGSGGGVRLLTPGNINVTNATITAAGGVGGIGGQPNGGAKNKGGDGANGRVVFEDGDSVITGLGSGMVVPGEGSPGFNRGVFDSSRFAGGGLSPWAITDPFPVGPLFAVDYVTPVQADFIAGIPTNMSRGIGKVGILIEARGYALLPDGTPNPVPGPWHTVGYLADSGVASQPTWVPNANPAVPADLPFLPNPNPPGIANLNDLPYIQFRITTYLPTSAGVFDPGPFLDRFVVTFNTDT